METSRMHREITINRMAATMAHLSSNDIAARVVDLLINDQGNINRYRETIDLVLEAHRQCILIHRIGKDRIKHRKGGTYELAIPIGRVQTDKPLKDYDEVSVYLADSDGSWWIRPLDEMADGRFEIVESIPKHEPPADGKERSSSGFSFDSIVLSPGSALRRIIELESIIENFDKDAPPSDALQIERLSGLTYAIQHSPNCPSRYLVRLVGKSGRIDFKPYGNGLPQVKHETTDILGFGKTLEEAVTNALKAKEEESKP